MIFTTLTFVLNYLSSQGSVDNNCWSEDMGAEKGTVFFKAPAQCGYKLACAPLYMVYNTPQINSTKLDT